MVEVVQVTLTRGEGTDVDPVRTVIQWWLENDMQVPRQDLVDSLVAIRELWIRTPRSKASKPS